MGHKGYYGQYTGNSKFSKKHDEAYDAKEAYNKDLTASARLHYLENDRHDHNSPARQDKKMMVKKIACKEGYEMNENGKCVPVVSPANRMGEMNDHDMGFKDWAAHKKTMHGIRDHGGPNMIAGMGKKAVKAIEGYKEARMQDPEEARYEEMSRKMDIKRKAAAKMHCTK